MSNESTNGYQTIIKKLNEDYIKDKTKYFNEKIKKYQSSNEIYKLIQIIHLSFYEMSYIFNVIEYIPDKKLQFIIAELIIKFKTDLLTNKEIYIYLTENHNNIKGPTFLIYEKIMKIFKYQQDENLKSLIQSMEGIKGVINNNKENQKLINIKIISSVSDNLTESTTDIMNNSEFELSENNSDIDLQINTNNKKEVGFVIDKLKNVKDRHKLLSDYFNQMTKSDETNKIYNLSNFYMIKNLFEKTETGKNIYDIKELKDLRNSDFFLFQNTNILLIEKMLNDLIQLLNDNYIKNYVCVFDRSEDKENLTLSDIDYFINQKKIEIENNLGLFKTDEILNFIFEICLKYFNVEFKQTNKYSYGVYLKNLNQNGLIGHWDFKFDENKNILKTDLNILNDRFKFKENGKEKINIIYLISSCCCGEFINFKKINELVEQIGEGLSYLLNFQESIINRNNKNKLFSSLFKLVFFDDEEQIMKKYNEQSDLINEYLDCDYIFKYKKIIIHLLMELKVYYNKEYIIKQQQILTKEEENKAINSIISLILEKYNSLFDFVYNTETYTIKHNNYEFYDLNYEIQTSNNNILDFKVLPFQDLNIIFSDILAYELFYDIKLKKFNILEFIKYINNKIKVNEIIKRDIDYQILIYHTIETKKLYNSLTEGLFKVIDTVNN